MVSQMVALWAFMAIWVGLDEISSVALVLMEAHFRVPFGMSAVALGLDGLTSALLMILGILAVVVFGFLASGISAREVGLGLFMAWVHGIVAGCFILWDLLGFFVGFEWLLLPLFTVVLVWGSGSKASNAAFKLVLYTLIGAVFYLWALA